MNGYHLCCSKQRRKRCAGVFAWRSSNLASNNPAGPGSVFGQTGSEGLFLAKAIVFGPDGNLYVADYNRGDILRFNGTTGAADPSTGQAGAIYATGINDVTGLAFNPNGTLYASSPDIGGFGAVVQITQNVGGVTTVSPYSSGNLLTGDVGDLTSDASGNLYVSDKNQVIRISSTNQAQTNVITNPTASGLY